MENKDMDNNYEKIVFSTEDGDEEFFVIEQTMLGGVNYILVTDEADSDQADFMILKEVESEDEDFVSYHIIEDDKELKAVVAIFNELVDDFDLEV